MRDRSNALQPREDAGKATAENGLVILDGPDGIAVTMTADAAARTADSLHEAARQVRESQALLGSESSDPPQGKCVDDPS